MNDSNIIKINDNTWRIEDGFVRSFLLVGEEKAVLLDSGATNADARKIAESVTDLPITLVNTHGDGDHVAGNGEFAEFYMHPDDYKNCGVQERFSNSICKALNDGDLIELGGRTLEIIGIPGHTYGSVAVLDETNRMLFSGDSVQNGRIFLFGKHRCPEHFADSLRKLQQLQTKFDKIYPSHDTPELDVDYIAKVLNAWKKVCAGEISSHIEILFGNEVLCYDTEDCGFYCEKN